ncbi:hypothetical protein GO013_06580 [Pseudodesulfovibrio sp. JC047]|uniref:hypothetical protein n=1 Tax=Pseudodesulfovibrio sp. JC047 TaxID=2683199 RepID=UPI0013D61063|nr:hypothetical protein [Pseudodesulfovibrio sp. JC047]NDV19085.1 hypothetical protein [Pseudodesulfovibrio sp. JC047]
MTHAQVVKKAKDWLRLAKKCNPVFAERGGQVINEFPDAIGFTAHETIVVECKVSKSDLLADKKKPFRSEGGLGDQRYYMLPASLYDECEDHDWGGWGVVLCGPDRATKQVWGMKSADFTSNLKVERDFLRSRVMEIQRFGT